MIHSSKQEKKVAEVTYDDNNTESVIRDGVVALKL